MQFRLIKPKLNSFLLLVTLLCHFQVWSCGDSKSPSEYPTFGTGELSFNVVYHNNADRNLRSEAAKIDCDGQGIATVEAKVYDSHNNMKIADGGPWNCDDGHGKISSVQAGSDRTVVVLGKDADKNVIFRGQTSGIEVIAGSENNIGTIECYGFVPNPLAPTDKAVVVQDTVVLQWEEVAGATEYRVLVSQNNDMSDPDIEDFTTTANYTPSGLALEITYYWQVSASDSEGNTGSDSQIWSVKMTDSTGRLPDTGQEHIEGYEPVDGEDMTYTVNPPSYTKLDSNGNTVDAGAADWAMVRDNVTGLIWETKTDDDATHDKDITYRWQDAQRAFISTLNDRNFGGYDDWRLPTVKELSVIVHRGKIYSAINTDYFPNTMSSTSYWSATRYLTTNAWMVSFQEGGVTNTNEGNSCHVRAVRGLQPSSNLVDNGNDTVTDTSTGLIWQKFEGGTMSWYTALNYCEALDLAGCDWRLPNINELQSIVDYENLSSEDGPAIDTKFFPYAVSNYYWSATTYAGSTDTAWKVYFKNGQIGRHEKSSGYHVRAVCSGS